MVPASLVEEDETAKDWLPINRTTMEQSMEQIIMSLSCRIAFAKWFTHY
jgi:hypothetical protein